MIEGLDQMTNCRPTVPVYANALCGMLPPMPPPSAPGPVIVVVASCVGAAVGLAVVLGAFVWWRNKSIQQQNARLYEPIAIVGYGTSKRARNPIQSFK